ncbi:hypothetical protein V6N13_115854 [Hibiscus sabdariffa]
MAKINKELHAQRSRSSSLLGCNSSKSVKIAGYAHKTNQKGGLEPRMRCVAESYMPVTRFRAEAKLSAAGASKPTRKPRILTTWSLSIPYSHSPPQTPNLLYIQ